MIEIQLPRGGRVRAALFGLLTAGALVQSPIPAMAGTTSFNGQLDYSAFKRTAERRETVRITYSPGGTGAAALALARNKVIVDGQCNSACAWSFVKNENACFTSRAVFGFHAAHDPGTGRRMNAATSYWLSTVRASLRGRLSPLLETSSLINISASQMRAYYGDRVCAAAEPKAEVASASPRPNSPKPKETRIASRDGKAANETASRKAGSRSAAKPADAQSFEALTASLSLLDGTARATEPDVTFASFITTNVPRFAFGPESRAEIARAVAILALPDMPDEPSYVAASLVEVASAEATKTDRNPIAREWLMIATRNDDDDADGRSVVGLTLARDETADASDIARPIAWAVRSWALSSRIAAAGGEKRGVLANLADPAARPEDCTPNMASLIKIQEVSAGPCDLSASITERADRDQGRTG